MHPRLLAFVLVVCWFGVGLADEPKKADKPSGPDLSEFRTVHKAIKARISKSAPGIAAEKKAGYFGAFLDAKDKNLVVSEVVSGSPAESARLRAGDVLSGVDGKTLTAREQFRDILDAHSAGDALDVVVVRGEKKQNMKVTLAPTSEPMTGSSGRRPRPLLGISSGPSEKGVLISRVTPGFAAANAGLRSGDVIVKIDGSKTPTIGTLRAILAKHKPGDQIVVVYTRDDKEKETKVKLGAAGGPRGWDARPNRRRTWSKPTYRLAVIPVEFSDVSHNEKIGTKNWTTALFSKGEYSDKSVTGQKVFGSLNDYYREISYGKFTVTGKVFDFVKVEKKRNDYSNSGPRRSTLLVEAVDLLLERDGEDALKDFDGIFFLYAGARARTQRGGLYWPHRATFTHRRKRWSYFICPEGGGRMESISVIAHEFGHMLGLPDLYAQQGSTTRAEGLGVWCTMSTGHGRSGRPLHFSAWTKEQLGWIEPAVIDPRVKQKLVLEPIIDSNEECYKVLLKPDASEYLLLENRVKQGFDSNLPGEGLLIWRVVNGRPILLESHGITDTSGPKRYLSAVPFPSKSNSSFTPRTIPSSKGTSGSYPVHITNIQRLEDGRIIFYIGYELF